MRQLLFAVCVLLQLNANAAVFESLRCAQYNDSLDGPQAEARTAWAAKCYPEVAFQLDNGKALMKDTATGEVVAAYPIFAEMVNGAKVHRVAPIDPAAPCWDTNVIKHVGYCRAGCFMPDQQILMNAPGGYVEIKTAKENQYDDIFLIDGINQNGQVEFKRKTLAGYTVDMEDQHQPILIIRTNSGGELKVTPKHPLVDGRGYMVAADTLKVGKSLKTVDNKNDQIVFIEKVDYFGKVYNVDTGSTDIHENIIVANDFLSGTVYFQNDGVGHLNRLVLRSVNTLPEGMLK